MPAFFKGFGTVAAAAMMATTTAASAQSASIAIPASETVNDGSALHSNTGTATIVEIGILAALVVIILVATKNDGSKSGSTPASP